MTSAKEHYEELLGAVYTWSTGGMDAAVARGESELEALGAAPGATSIAVDLGAGFGMHAIPLARRGFEVIAIDSSQALLGELKRARGGHSIRAIDDDLLAFRRHLSGPVDLILCMGDTLTHIASREEVETLVAGAAAALAPGGRFVASFRDYSAPLEGTARFIPVRADADRIMTCFLEYGPEHVTVHDFLNERRDGQWRFAVSAYRKLRLAPDWVVGRLEGHGLATYREPGLSGMVRVVAERPA